MRQSILTCLIFLWLLNSFGCASTSQQSSSQEATAMGAIMGTAIFPGVGTVVGAGVGWLANRSLEKAEREKKELEIRDELEKQALLRERIKQLQATPGNPTAAAPENRLEQVQREFLPEIQKGWIGFSMAPEGIRLYLNEGYFFARDNALIKEAKGLLQRMGKLVQQLPSDAKVSLEDPDARLPLLVGNKKEKDQAFEGLSQGKIWSLASYLEKELGVPRSRLLVNGRPFSSEFTLSALKPQEILCPLQIILISGAL